MDPHNDNLEEIIRAQWNDMDDIPPELIGSAALGGGGRLEARYRHYFELRHFLKIVPLKRTMNVLELGSGNGRWGIALAPRVCSYTGVDFSKAGIRVARARASRKKLLNTTFLEQSISEFRGEGIYDLIYFSGTSQYLQDQQLADFMKRLIPHMSRETLLVDRCTVNYSARVVHNTPDYYCIYRTPEELAWLYREFGFVLDYRARAYRYLRGGDRMQKGLTGKWLPLIVRLLQPLSWHLLRFITWSFDQIRPPYVKGYHEFFVFSRTPPA